MDDDELFMCETIEQKAKINDKPLIGEIIFRLHHLRRVTVYLTSTQATLPTNDLPLPSSRKHFQPKIEINIATKAHE